MDPADGEAYSLKDFIAEYGGNYNNPPEQWVPRSCGYLMILSRWQCAEFSRHAVTREFVFRKPVGSAKRAQNCVTASKRFCFQVNAQPAKGGGGGGQKQLSEAEQEDLFDQFVYHYSVRETRPNRDGIQQRRRQAEVRGGWTSNVFPPRQRREAGGSCCVAAASKHAIIEAGPI